MDIDHLISILDVEAAALEQTVRQHPALRPFFSLDFSGVDVAVLRETYLRLLKMKADYVLHSVPMLRAAGLALRSGDDEDRAWSELFLSYAHDELDTEQDYGHHVWAKSDMRALGASDARIDAPPHTSVDLYGRYLVDEAPGHPYAILGTKGVLEHLSIRMSDDLVKGVLASGIEGAEGAVSFFQHHGVLDIDHVRGGDKNLERLRGAEKRFQVLQGAFFTSGSYRAFLHFYLCPPAPGGASTRCGPAIPPIPDHARSPHAIRAGSCQIRGPLRVYIGERLIAPVTHRLPIVLP